MNLTKLISQNYQIYTLLEAGATCRPTLAFHSVDVHKNILRGQKEICLSGWNATSLQIPFEQLE